MSFYDIMTTEYWSVPLWGWILIILFIVGIIAAVRSSIAKAEAVKKETVITDVETGNKALPVAVPPKTPTPVKDFKRDAPLPPPAPSETSNKG